MAYPSSSAARLAATLSSLIALGVRDHGTYRWILKETLENHPHHLGIWAWWERATLEGGAGSKDSSTRLAWCRSSTGITDRGGEGQPAVGPGLQRPLAEASKARRPLVIAPYTQTIDREERLLATIAAPIFLGQKCVGAVGLDFALDTLAESVAAGCSNTMMEAMDIITAELHVGLIFLDGDENVVAWSSSAPVMLGEFIKTPLQIGKVLPADLCHAPDESVSHGLEKTMDYRGAILKITRSERPLRGLPIVVVLTKEDIEISLPPLSEREDEVMRWLAEGKSNEEIGIILSISPHTVKNHLDRIYRKIGVDNRHAAMLAWTRAKALTGALPTV